MDSLPRPCPTDRAEILARLPHPLPARPFTRDWATAHGLSNDVLRALVMCGALRRPLRRVYVDAGIPDSTDLRIDALALVAPPRCVVCDWTSTWIWTGHDQPNAHLQVPRPSVFRFRGSDRTRHGAVRSGERWFLPGDVVPVRDGLLVATPLRTAWDMGRFEHKYVALGAMDALMRSDGFSLAELVEGVARFSRQRGVVQLRALAPLVDPRAESIPESALRLHWLEIPSAPRPTPQLVVPVRGHDYRLDLGCEELAYGAEYDGEEFHTADEDRKHDGQRREAISEDLGWSIEVFTKLNVFGQHADVDAKLRAGLRAARERSGLPFLFT